MDIFILVGLITLNGLFAMSELALVAAKSSRLKSLAQTQPSAQLALELKNNPTRFLSTIQIGITAIGILSGIFGEATLSAPFSVWLTQQGLEAELASIVATASVVVLITYFAIVVGELVPKRFAQRNAEQIAVIVAYPIHWLAIITTPFVVLLSTSTDALLKLFRQNGGDNDQITEEDIFAVVNEGSESGAIEPQEQEMIRNILHLNDRLVTSLMTPRCDMDYLDIEQPIESCLRQIRHTQHSVWPVCHGGLDNIIGTISSKVLLDQYESLSIEKIARLVRKPRYFPESMKGLPLLNQMQKNNCEMAFIVDEYGDIQGLVTHYDILESVAGELGLAPQHTWARQHQDGSWWMDALIPLNELKRRLDISTFEGEESEGFQTLNGFLTWLIGRVPEVGEVIDYQEWQFEVLKVQNNRILQVRVVRITG
ncbi:hemolysin family protein [Vibrio europaeus]|uniref:HlyC/CorC family transporter n=1 Tax=Vibrio europaeus TaxID=300876 RepID=A0AAE7DVF8_9VIBR|nr:hemolysin family protein [Vibrio europaeus]MDC5803802.1 hemolysin family protein [Vibrio europaeus]MDC5810300.1 hemolysin family protein [Vibrio europaeus]MDC5823675.1 hemolysin family protein [Vibrio europaeus]MDC5828489.1 hemolysin family protein [Vibrio europaeus]MDC5833407.1 hemolysin family protein [Vibrio europaeus]